LSGNGERIATANNDGELMICDVGKSEHRLSHHSSPVIAVDFSRDGNRLVSASKQEAFLWDLTRGERVLEMTAGDYYFSSVALSPDGARVATGDESGMITIWDSATKNSRELRHEHKESVRAMEFSSDSQLLASGSTDGSVRLWDLAVEDCAPRTLDLNGGQVMYVHFGPNGRLVTTGLNGTVKVWDTMSKGRLLLNLIGHSSAVEMAVFSSDGSRLATASWDRTARVWDVASGNSLLVLRHTREVKGVGFARDGMRLTTVSADGAIRVHFFNSEKLKELAQVHVTRSLSPEERKAYLEQDSSP
jgi:WD40 repeat protein